MQIRGSLVSTSEESKLYQKVQLCRGNGYK